MRLGQLSRAEVMSVDTHAAVFALQDAWELVSAVVLHPWQPKLAVQLCNPVHLAAALAHPPRTCLADAHLSADVASSPSWAETTR